MSEINLEIRKPIFMALNLGEYSIVQEIYCTSCSAIRYYASRVVGINDIHDGKFKFIEDTFMSNPIGHNFYCEGCKSKLVSIEKYKVANVANAYKYPSLFERIWSSSAFKVHDKNFTKYYYEVKHRNGYSPKEYPIRIHYKGLYLEDTGNQAWIKTHDDRMYVINLEDNLITTLLETGLFDDIVDKYILNRDAIE